MSLGKCFICSLTIQCQGSDDPVKDLTEVREEQSRRTTTVCLETWFSTSLERHGIFSKKTGLCGAASRKDLQNLERRNLATRLGRRVRIRPCEKYVAI
jgi:hypothetical protein